MVQAGGSVGNELPKTCTGNVTKVRLTIVRALNFFFFNNQVEALPSVGFRYAPLLTAFIAPGP